MYTVPAANHCLEKSYAAQQGVTLVELVIAISVIAICLTGTLQVMDYNTRLSATPMIERQALAVAESYMAEITNKEFSDPDVAEVDCDPLLFSAEEGARTDFDDVDDYNNLNQSPQNQNGIAIGALALYNVQVTISCEAINATPSTKVKRIDVIVAHSAGISRTLTGYRARY